MSENRRKTNTNMPLSQNFKDNKVKYSKDELLDIRKMVKQNFRLKQINIETLKVIRRYRINGIGKRSGLKKETVKTTSIRSQ